MQRQFPEYCAKLEEKKEFFFKVYWPSFVLGFKAGLTPGPTLRMNSDPFAVRWSQTVIKFRFVALLLELSAILSSSYSVRKKRNVCHRVRDSRE